MRQSDGAEDGGKDLVALVCDHASECKCFYTSMLCACLLSLSLLILFFVLSEGLD